MFFVKIPYCVSKTPVKSYHAKRLLHKFMYSSRFSIAIKNLTELSPTQIKLPNRA